MARNQNATTTIFRTLISSAIDVLTFPCPVSGQIIRAKVWSEVAPAGGNAVFDVNINGTTIWSDQTQRVKILDGDTDGEVTGLTSAVVKDDIVSLDFDGFTGSATGIGTFIRVIIEIEETDASALDSELGGGGGVSGVKLPIVTEGSQSNNYNTTDWDTPIRDDGGYYNAGIFSIEIPTSGWYNIAFQMNVHSAQSGDIIVNVGPGGSGSMTVINTPAPADAVFIMHGSAIDYYTAGDQIFVAIIQLGTSDIHVNTGGGTWFAIVPAGQA